MRHLFTAFAVAAALITTSVFAVETTAASQKYELVAVEMKAAPRSDVLTPIGKSLTSKGGVSVLDGWVVPGLSRNDLADMLASYGQIQSFTTTEVLGVAGFGWTSSNQFVEKYAFYEKKSVLAPSPSRKETSVPIGWSFSMSNTPVGSKLGRSFTVEWSELVRYETVLVEAGNEQRIPLVRKMMASTPMPDLQPGETFVMPIGAVNGKALFVGVRLAVTPQ